VQVQVARVNREERKIDFIVLEDENAPRKRRPKKQQDGPRRQKKGRGKGRKSRTAA
jgi:hypothetical protein